MAIPGGCCVFDLPFYHYWLNLDTEKRHQDFKEWLGPFQPVRNAFEIVLYLLRKSGKTINSLLVKVFFNKQAQELFSPYAKAQFKMTSFPCIPEISANKYALNIRFIPIKSTQKNKTYEGDVAFELTFCNL